MKLSKVPWFPPIVLRNIAVGREGQGGPGFWDTVIASDIRTRKKSENEVRT